MSRDGTIEITFLDGEDYVFRLAWGQLIKLQEERKCGPFVVFERLHGSEWMLEDIREVVRLGLIGAGMDEIKARKLVREYIERRPPIKSLPIAQAIIQAAVLGPPDEEALEKSDGAERIDNLDNGRIRVGALYGAGALMGFTPQQVDQMSTWQFNAAAIGWAKQFETGLSSQEADELWGWLQAKDDVPLSLSSHKRRPN